PPGPGQLSGPETPGFTVHIDLYEQAPLILQITPSDLKQMQSVQGKNGHIKRPMNAFMVWSYIHRCVLRRACPRMSTIEASVHLGCEWSKLSAEQKRPYFEMAHKLKILHKHQFPDYEFRPQKKRGRESLSTECRAGQEGGEDPGISAFTTDAIPPTAPPSISPPQPNSLDYMYPYPILMSYTVGYNLYPWFCPYYASALEEVRNYHNNQLPWDDTVMAAMHQPPVVHHDSTGSTVDNEYKCEENVVVGLLNRPSM
uniref:HMG box domain-containing protein n=1 Tax=Echeneis naucrates TaxID=173247 RepID=A0A665TYV9_ECHNA